MEKEQVLNASAKFWEAMESADEKGMRTYASKDCRFVHIGITCSLDKEIEFYTSGAFKPTSIVIHAKDAQIYENCAVVITDCDYSLLLDGKETTHHFAVTEVFDASCKLVQFTFTALVY